ncbi:MAG TPA: glucose 1-dehydrogenase [Pseudonocardiaceae bacterium]|jgi:NAD(P)-dependent dehydrogenase (short-subunit alcohol dehydrogenase family)|nr:glucose 1-dehydrogenase [Pseudonocardiaceae bacterium]
MTDRYEGKRVVITGGTSGFGLTTAKQLVNGGARVLVTGRSTDALEAAAKELGERASVLRSDAASPADLEELAERVKTDLGGVDLLFVNAGVTRFVPFEQVDEDTYDRLFDINAKGAYFTVQKLAPLIVDGGAVVLTTSVANVKGLAGVSVYSASKAALRSMARTIARELMPRNIRVNAVTPGPIDTGILDKVMPAEAAEQTKNQMRENNPMKRFGRPEEITKAVLFLGFDATFTTGAELAVDGGASQL